MSAAVAMKKGSSRTEQAAAKATQAGGVPALIVTGSDRVLAVTKQMQMRLTAIVKDPRFQVTTVSAGGGAATFAVVGGGVGCATGATTGFAAGVLPAIFTFGLSMPAGALIGGTVGAGTGAVVGAGSGFVGGGVAGSVAYAYRVQIKEGKVYVIAKVKDISSKVSAKTVATKGAIVNKTMDSTKQVRAAVCSLLAQVNKKQKELIVGGKARSLKLYKGAKTVAGEKQFQVTAASATGGAAVGGVGGGAVGLTAGAMVGGAIGVIPALFTFGLSIPLGAAIGGGTGLCVGATTGSGAGAVTGGAVGFGAYKKRAEIDGAVKGTQKKATDMIQFVKGKGKDTGLLVQKKIQGYTGGSA